MSVGYEGQQNIDVFRSFPCSHGGADVDVDDDIDDDDDDKAAGFPYFISRMWMVVRSLFTE